jgi:hypothetical protein
MSIVDAFTYYANQDIWKYFKNGDSVIHGPEIQRIFRQQGVMGKHGTPLMPLFVYLAIGDELASIKFVDRLVDKYCEAGANILYERNEIGGHLAEETNGDSRALKWLGKVLRGDYSHESCTIRNVSVNITDMTD